MRPLVACSLFFVSACATIAGLEGPHDEETLGVDAGADTSNPPPPPQQEGGADTGVDVSVDAPKDTGGNPPSCDANGLVARWMFDEGAGSTAHDCTKGQHDGTITGAKWATGKFGGALQFVDDMVDVGNPPELQLTGAMTLSAWIYIAANSTASGRIISKSSQADRGWEINIEGGTVLEFKIAIDMPSYAEVTSAITTGAWHHVLGTYQPSTTTMRLYIDGVEAGSKLDAPTVGRDSPFNVLLGAMPNETADRFDGRLDDIRVYSRALSAAEVQTVMNGN